MIGQGEQRVFVGCLDIWEPFYRDAVGEEGLCGDVAKERRFGGRRIDVNGDFDFFDGFADLDELGGASFRVCFQFAALGPFVGFVVVIDVTEEQAGGGAMDDDSDVEVDADGGEIGIADFVEFVELEAGVGGVELEIKGSGLDSFLLLVGEFA